MRKKSRLAVAAAASKDERLAVTEVVRKYARVAVAASR